MLPVLAPDFAEGWRLPEEGSPLCQGQRWPWEPAAGDARPRGLEDEDPTAGGVGWSPQHLLRCDTHGWKGWEAQR